MNAWSREDIIIAYALYCVTPLGKINPSNKVIQQVAEIIPHSVVSTNLIAGRTPEVTIVVLPYGFVLATQIKDRL